MSGGSYFTTVAWLIRILAVATISFGCAGAEPASVLDVRLGDGSALSETVKADTTTIVLVYEPGMCFSCSPMFTRWEAAAQRHGARLLLVLADEPSVEAARALRRLRIPVAGIAASWPKRLVPAEYVFRNGELVDKAEGLIDMQRRKLWEKEWLRS